MFAVIRANSTVRKIVRLINASAEGDQQVSPYGWHPAKGRRVMERYAALYPRGTLRKAYGAYVVLAAIGMLGTVLALMTA